MTSSSSRSPIARMRFSAIAERGRRTTAEGRRRRGLSVLGVLCSAFWLGCASAPQQPGNSATQQPLAAAPSDVSTLTIPIHTTLAPLLPQLEAQVPKTMQKLDGYELDPTKQYGLKYKVTRDPIALNMAGTGLHATVTVRDQLE